MGYFIGIGDTQIFIEEDISPEEATKRYRLKSAKLENLPPVEEKLMDMYPKREDFEGMSITLLKEKYPQYLRPYINKKELIDKIMEGK